MSPTSGGNMDLWLFHGFRSALLQQPHLLTSGQAYFGSNIRILVSLNKESKVTGPLNRIWKEMPQLQNTSTKLSCRHTSVAFK